MNLPAHADDEIGGRVQTQAAPRLLRGVTGGKENFGVVAVNAYAVVDDVEIEKLPVCVGPDANAGRFSEAVRGGKVVDGFHRILDQIDHHLMKSTLLNPNFPRRVAALDLDLDPPVGE